MKYAVFIEPSGALRDCIENWKRKVDVALPSQPYCSHPPHCSLYVTQLPAPDVWMNELAKKLRASLPLTICVNQKHIFYSDALTDGGHTLALRIAANMELYALQMLVADTLGPFALHSDSRHLLAAFPQTCCKSSIQKYAYPFVGSHWIPHFTIASLQTEKDHPLIADFIADAARFVLEITQVSIWGVIGDIHTQIGVLRMGSWQIETGAKWNDESI